VLNDLAVLIEGDRGDAARANAGPPGDLIDWHRRPRGGERVIGDRQHAGAVAGRIRAQRPVKLSHVTSPRELPSGAGVPYSWSADIPDQTGRTAVITVANTGLGCETAAALAGKGAHVVLAVCNLDKGKKAAERISAANPGASVAVQELDLSSLESVRARLPEGERVLVQGVSGGLSNAAVAIACALGG
jgi:NADPH:quinone reductase-like Zn-dependent oxidoreductase